MSRLKFTIASLVGVVAVLAVSLAVARVSPALGAGIVLTAGLATAAYLLGFDPSRPIGWPWRMVLGAWIVAAPAVLFFDPATFAPGTHGHIDRPPRDVYLIYSDDVAYVAASRTWDRTVANLLVPHNTHIVPSWRLLTWALVAAAGDLHGLPDVLAVASYGVLIAVMLMVGRLVGRETGRASAGLAAMGLVGTTSLMLTPAMWFSGGQPLWAVLGVLASLGSAQSYRRTGRWRYLAASAIACTVSGGFWSAGHLAGPVTALYLWLDGRRRPRFAAAVPLVATAAAVGLMLALAAQPIDARVSFHGRTAQEAANPVQGALTTAQAIPANLVLGSLGLDVEPTQTQGLVLTLALLAIWARHRWRPAAGTTRPGFAINPIEGAGASIVVGCYLLEWTFRGYLDLHNMRTISPYAVVPWYDAMPMVGASLFAVGWWSGPHHPSASVARRPIPPTRAAAIAIAAMVWLLVLANRPRVDVLIRGTAPSMSAWERDYFKIDRLQTMRASLLRIERAAWQRRYLRRLDQAEAVARRLGIGREEIRSAFGHVFIPASTGRLLLLQRDHYDVAAILDLPDRGRVTDLSAIRSAMARYLIAEPEPRPQWLPPSDPWPPE